jgi:small subunit ribosomal protein S16
MPAKIRLQRFGKKGYAYYHIVVADGRAPRDGKFIEKIGSYNPNTNPATIEIDRDRAVEWLRNGAQPTDTTRAILSYKGVLYKHHLQQGVTKGAISQETADSKFAAWEADKQSRVGNKVSMLADSEREAKKKQMAEESKIRETRAEAAKAKMAAAAVSESETGETAPEADAPEAESGEAPAAE